MTPELKELDNLRRVVEFYWPDGVEMPQHIREALDEAYIVHVEARLNGTQRGLGLVS